MTTNRRDGSGTPAKATGIALAIFFTTISLSFEASAYTVKVTSAGDPVRWENDEITVTLDDSLAALGDATEVESVVMSAMSTWEQSGVLPVTFRVASSTGAEPGYRLDGDNHNHVMANEGPWPYDPSWPAVTISTYDDVTGELLDADIVIDANRRWSTTDAPSEDELDLRDVTTHEMGHLLGLEHSDVVDAAMYPESTSGSTARRNLHVDDINALVAAYGPPAPLSRRDPAAAGCSAAPGAGSTAGAGWLAMAFGLCFALRRRPR